jgi:Tfp pilus assembly protein PilV
MKKRNGFISGFSLVEVTLALGVVVFCLVTILGLLAIGINSTQVSTVQTSATNILTAVVADLQSTPNPVPKGSAQASLVYGISLPAVGAGASTTPTTIYIGEDGKPSATASGALYRLSVWTTPPTTTKQETLVRLLITWPVPAAYTNPQGYIESVVALNRT